MKMIRFLYLFLTFYAVGASGRIVLGQDSLHQISKEKMPSTSRNAKKTESLRNLSDALESNDDNALASQYESLGRQYFAAKDYQRAETNFKQALAVYKRLKNKAKMSEMSRQIARSQEAQNEKKQAAASYKEAGRYTDDQSLQRANQLDAKRVSEAPNVQQQRDWNNTNAELMQSAGKQDEAAEIYKNQAILELQNNNVEEAVEMLQEAMVIAPDNSQKNTLKQELAEVLAKDKKLDDARRLSEEILLEAQQNKDVILQIDQLKKIANFYLVESKSDSALLRLHQAYDLAFEYRMTKDAKNLLTEIVSLYRNDADKSLQWHSKFVQDLEILLAEDTTLTDDQLATALEEKISTLEQQTVLQTQIIESKNRYNYVLLGSLLLLFGLLAIILASLRSIKKRNKKIELESLRRAMNPHFIFNSLNSVNHFIAQNDELEANRFLTSYSSLMRHVLEYSNQDFVRLSEEYSQLKKYLDLEQMRFRDQFTYKIIMDSDIDADTYFIPNMLIQPQLENAVWHGLRYIKQKGLLQLHFYKNTEGELVATITDNGIGIEASKQMKTKHQQASKSYGIKNTAERIRLLNDLYRVGIEMNVESDTSGTRVIFNFGKAQNQYGSSSR